MKHLVTQPHAPRRDGEGKGREGQRQTDCDTTALCTDCTYEPPASERVQTQTQPPRETVSQSDRHQQQTTTKSSTNTNSSNLFSDHLHQLNNLPHKEPPYTPPRDLLHWWTGRQCPPTRCRSRIHIRRAATTEEQGQEHEREIINPCLEE